MTGKPLCLRAQEMVLNVLEYFETEKKYGGPFIPVTDVQERVAGALKISRRTVWKIKKRKENDYFLTSPLKPKCRRLKPKTGDLPENIKLAIKDTLFDMCKDGKHVTIKKLNEELKRKEIVSMGTTSLNTLVKELGFKYKKEENHNSSSSSSDEDDSK